jgi:excisionase family DNA binding protein/PAS domain S-box-containing protein
MLTSEFLLGFLESYPAAVTVFEPDGTIVFANELGCDLVKLPKSELVGKRVQDFITDKKLADRLIARIVTKGHMEGELNLTQSDGDSVDVRLLAVMVKGMDGKPMGVVGIARGIGNALRRPGEVAEVMQRILDQFPEANMLTVEEVATELRVSKETVRRWVRSGQLPSVKLPRGIRIPSEVIRDLIRANLE